jgi:hypothetical protein
MESIKSEPIELEEGELVDNVNINKETTSLENCQSNERCKKEQSENSLIINQKEKDCFDLDTGLLKLGWRKYFSKRENRFYYYNILCNQSVWSLNELLVDYYI